MRIAVISDIHGNLEALKKAFEYIEKNDIDEVICLGDVVGYGPNPNECVELIKEKVTVCLLGNHDNAAIGKQDITYFNKNAKLAVLWTQEQLSQENKH